jgi:CheY-like chemotaxis protein
MAKILIVDDDIETTNLLKTIVMRKGHQPTSVNNSMSAVEVANSTLPDLILLDILMPGINGIQLCKIFQSTSNLKHIPIIIVSAVNDLGSKRDAFNAGAKDFLSKPVRADDLTQKIETLVASS